MTREELCEKHLPRWSQCLIYGKKISEEQALEIIRRTDSFFVGTSGNNKDFIRRAREITRSVDFFLDDYDKKTYDEFIAKWQVIPLNYITNNWISCSYIGGPHGWCRPDGIIEYHHNVGKYANPEGIYDDLVAIAEAFPFIEMTVTLADDEADSDEPLNSLISFVVANGKVEILDTPISYYEASSKAYASIHTPFANPNYNDSSIEAVILRGHESAIGLQQLQIWADKVYGESNTD